MSSSAPPERRLALQGSYNTRDIGGYPTLDGRRTRWRTVLRSDSLHRLSLADQQQLLNYGLRTIIDLRWADEAAWEPSVFAAHPHVRYRCIPFYGDQSPYELDLPRHMGAIYLLDLERQKTQIRTVIESLLEPNAAPVLVHCAVGKDRTGLIIALLLGLAKVPAELIIEDYALSARYLAAYFDQLRREVTPEALEQYGYSLECAPEFMADVLAYLQQHYGGVAGYVRSLGLSGEQICRLCSMLVEPQPG